MDIIDRILFEAKQVGILYHFTSFGRLLSILDNNVLKCGNYGFISFTRDKHFYKKQVGVNNECCLVINGNKLSNNYKILPYNNSVDVTRDEDTESEERIKIKEIKNINEYILGIFIDDQEIDLDEKTIFINKLKSYGFKIGTY